MIINIVQKQISKIYFIIMLMAFLCTTSLQAIAAEMKFVFDEAGVLSTENYSNIEKQAIDIFEDYKVGVYTIIVASMPIKDEQYIDSYVLDFANEFIKNKTISNDKILLFICVEEDNRWRQSFVYGNISKKLAGYRLRNIQNAVTHMLTGNQYYEAIGTYYSLIKSHFIINGK